MSSAKISGKYFVGVLVGDTSTVAIQNCSNEGSTVTATGWYVEGDIDYAWLGGYVGNAYSISDCKNGVDITYTGVGRYVGGIAGYAASTIQSCENNGNVTSAASYVGGIAGYCTFWNVASWSAYPCCGCIEHIGMLAVR